MHAETTPDYRRKRASKIPAGNRQTRGSLFASTGGADRPRLTTTLPLEALEQLDTLALAHNLQRNEVLTLALAALAALTPSGAAPAPWAAAALERVAEQLGWS